MIERMVCALGEVKFADDAVATRKFSGYGAVFKNIDSYGDAIEPGAFANFLSDVKSGKQPWPAMLSQHGGFGLTAQDMTPIGVWTSLSEDGHGLVVEGELAGTPRGEELGILMKMKPRPAIDGLSIGYVAKEWEPRGKPEEPRRRLKRIDLIEISPVTFPANRKARVKDVKSIEEITSLADAEGWLREACGLSKSEAVTLVSRVKSFGSLRRDSDDGLGELRALIERRSTFVADQKESNRVRSFGDQETH